MDLQRLYEQRGYSCKKIPYKDEYLINKNDEPNKYLKVFSHHEATKIEENIRKYEECLKENYLRDLELAKQWGIYKEAKALFKKGYPLYKVKELIPLPKELENSALLKDVLKAIMMEEKNIKG